MKIPMFVLMAALALTAMAAPQRERSEKDAAARPGIIAPAAVGELRLRATFVSCSVCFGASTPIAGLSLECRAVGGEWKAQPLPPYFPETKDYRGSILGLAEDTTYDVRLMKSPEAPRRSCRSSCHGHHSVPAAASSRMCASASGTSRQGAMYCTSEALAA